MPDLQLQDFAGYFEAVHGHQPFPWQQRLMEQVAKEGRWPGLLDLPTGAGKTAALDIALFHRALEADRPDRRAPTRIVVVIDRRTIVDQTVQRATRICRKLNASARHPILQEVARRLRAGSPFGKETDDALHVATLRGGMAREDAWARRPDQPTILVSTVDQAGSRLLFRGYGVSESMRPIHAGLLGNDTLFLLDEVHLSEPFRQTLASLAERYRRWAERPLDERWQVVEMSATPTPSVGPPQRAFRLDEDDRHHPLLQKRLKAPKPVRLAEPVKVTGQEETRVRKFADALTSAALVNGEPEPGKTLGIVVNRVSTARAVYQRLQQLLGGRTTVILLTGRMRPADRVRIQKEIERCAGAGRPGRSQATEHASAIVVATQCIEAGADLDFDVLISECASWDALKQRFGRLNRLGDASACRGVVLIRGDQLDSVDDPVYGEALARTWAWLRAKGEEIDLGISAPLVGEPCPADCLPTADCAPVMLPAHLDAWTRTNPAPVPDPEVALWLHGPQRDAAEVQIIWRADIGDADLSASDRSVVTRISSCPPSSGEALSIPIGAARAWLRGEYDAATNIPDTSFREDDEAEEVDPYKFRPALRWRADDSEIVATAKQIAPGDTLIVPAAYGGLTADNWDPASQAPVRDLGDYAAMMDRRIPTLRLLPEVLASDFGPGAFPIPPARSDLEDSQAEDEVLDAWLAEAKRCIDNRREDLGWLSDALVTLGRHSVRRFSWLAGTPANHPNGIDPLSRGYYVLVSRRKVDTTTEDDSSSFSGRSVPLEEHLRGVADWARALATGAGLPQDLVSAVEVAARWHDIGKADPRFQLLLHGGDRFKHAVAPSLLAKSGLPLTDAASRRRAAESAGYPRGGRHELMSLALLCSAQAGAALPPDVDRDLVLHLVASHHGYCRPFAPVVFDEDPRTVEYEGPTGTLRAASDYNAASFDSGVSERFFSLTRRYGWFGLAWMEAILRLADHRRSEAEQSGES